MGFQISQLFAWVVIDDDGDEAIPATLGPGGTWLPLIGGDEARIESMRLFARIVAAEKGRPVRLLRFTTREELETIEPPGESRTKH